MITRRGVLGVATLFLSGCHINEPRWTLRILDFEIIQQETHFLIKATVGLAGQYSIGVSIREVRVCFLDSENQLLETASVGIISNNRAQVTVSTELPIKPTILALGHGEVDSEAEYSVRGYRDRGDGTYSAFYQEETFC